MTRKILVVDDEYNMVHLLRTIFETTGYTVLSATSGKEALISLKNQIPDLILLDIMMPDMDGWELYREIKKRTEWRDIPIVIITAKKDEIEKKMGTDLLKVDGYITKPFVRKVLVNKINNLLDSLSEN